MRPVAPAEELCIFYGTKLWFEDRSGLTPPGEDEALDLWVRLANVELDDARGDPDELVSEGELPFEKVAVTGDDHGGEDEAEVQTSTSFFIAVELRCLTLDA